MLRQSIILFFCILPALAADVALTGDSRLTGEISNMSEDGTITLVSPISKIPILVNGEHVKSVRFETPKDASAVPDQRVRLVNGDVLPLKVTAMDAAVIQTSSDDMGDLVIPRDFVDSIQLGIVPQKTVYTGPQDFEGWIRDENGSRNWTSSDENFIAEGEGRVSRKIDLPEKFIIRFDLGWSNHPNFCFTFADPLKPASEASDRYSFEFSGAGVSVKRESTGSIRFTPIILLSRTPEQFPYKSLMVEIRVDRSCGLLQLYLNGEFEGRYRDPVQKIPTGSGISLLSLAPRESKQTIGRIKVMAWDDRGDRHRSEDRGDGKTDSLIGRFGERFGGDLNGIRKDAEGSVYLFKSDFQEEIIEMPESEVSTVFLAGASKDRNPGAHRGLVLGLRGEGEIRVSSCEFSEKSVKVVHPLLGSMELAREAVTHLARVVIPKANAVENP